MHAGRIRRTGQGGVFAAAFIVCGAAGAAPAAKPPPKPGVVLTHMQLQAQFAGPLQDTIIQRWRDPQTGIVCYIYMPILVAHAPSPMGFVQYGANNIGSISCLR